EGGDEDEDGQVARRPDAQHGRAERDRGGGDHLPAELLHAVLRVQAAHQRYVHHVGQAVPLQRYEVHAELRLLRHCGRLHLGGPPADAAVRGPRQPTPPPSGVLMPLLYACVALVAALCLLDMLMTFAITRRLRVHTELLAGRDPVDLPIIGVPVGEIPTAGPRTTLAGERLDGLAGLRPVSFFSTSCSACPEQVPPFASSAS